ncbi:MAG: protein-methionine-sulfoxide reductase catalytic subunit MsrP [Pseudomonadales bacterium]|nr:protein-methionine-sulfoxide reductase catalytic subunit MsrP [Pseudomonadales bacterium]MDP6471595.1 protein-methionine-sulfoxide reductase catalytic subunit MsrP [Pseudomonadales bacterium]MDP6828858.1 protein-methionine-sulfoxide reductase catalytic subunit MsrP [Pseudomonadales bacterium]MDP6970614.1 protein-methionine-sulfoxide reductase catalytic subunit MsrP [Pseudomonadales bacterium]
MLISKPADIAPSCITSETAFQNRRKFVQTLGLASGVALLPRAAGASLQEELTPERIVTSYNNFYEFGMDKTDPAAHAHELTVAPWSIEVSGEAKRTGTFALEDVLKGLSEEDRIYRFRCVEAWSMVVPWRGVPMKTLLEKFEPTGNAKYVEFTTLKRPSEMRAQRSYFSGIDWPYVEGLRMDEAYHPLTLMVTGVYGKALPKQNGAPLRLMVPWKYGFKSGKSIVKIRFSAQRPVTTWNVLQPDEYGFYANVNPAVDHPRWSQAVERRLPSSLFSPNRIPTLPFNGYAEEVAYLYAGMDLTRHY